MNTRKVFFWVWMIWQNGGRWPFLAFGDFLDRRNVLPQHDGILLVNLCHQPGAEGQFHLRIREALEFIERSDPRRYRRIKREIRRIMNAPVLASGNYQRPFRTCIVDLLKLHFETHPEWSLYCLSSLLVHEATHGSCYSRCVGYTRRTRERIERLCHREEERFAKRAFPENAADVIGEFDLTWWRNSWATPRIVKRWKALRRGYQESIRYLLKGDGAK